LFYLLNQTQKDKMNDAMMLDSEFYPAIGPESTVTSIHCDGEEEDLNVSRQSASSTAMVVPSIARGYAPAEMENALRVMSHAGRILWKAAMEAIPGGAGSYNPSLDVLSKLWKHSFRKTKKNDSTKDILSAFPFGKTKAATGANNDVIAAFSVDHDDAMQTVPDCTSDSYNATEKPSDTDDQFPPTAKKRKMFFRLSSLLPSIVSDSEGEEDGDRPSKRVRRTFEDEHVTHYW